MGKSGRKSPVGLIDCSNMLQSAINQPALNPAGASQEAPMVSIANNSAQVATGAACREAWLCRAAELLKSVCEPHFTYPERLRISCGWPSKSALAARKRRIGECWATTASKDRSAEIFISPCLDDPQLVVGVLLHELIHAGVGVECGHKGPFKRAALAIGMEGKMTETLPGPALRQRIAYLIEDLGPYPHACLDGMERAGPKKQGTRMMKVECPSCGYTVRTTAKWLEIGTPTCPCGEQMVSEGSEE